MWYKIARGLGKFWFTITHHGVRVHNRELLPEGGAVICPNHTALRDPLYVAVAMKPSVKMRYMAKAELFESRLLGWFLNSLGAFPVKRGTADIQAIRESIKSLNDGCKLVVFPEGTRVTEGKEAEAKGGAAMLAAKTGLPIVPTYISNGRTFFKRVDVVFGEPIYVGRPREEQRAAVDKVMTAIEELKCKLK